MTLSLEGRVATVVLDNEARRNALSAAMWRRLRHALDEAAAAPGIRVTVLRGAGRAAFCAGGDLDDLDALADDRARDSYVRAVEDAFDAVLRSPLPVLALLHGATVGGGMALACACDLRLADTELRIGIPATRLGVVPSATELDAIASLAGPARTAELFYTGRLLRADEALEWGLVNRVVPAGELEGAAYALADEIARAAPDATRATRRLLVERRFGGDRREAAATAESLGGPELAESLAALRERRAPEFADVEVQRLA